MLHENSNENTIDLLESFYYDSPGLLVELSFINSEWERADLNEALFDKSFFKKAIQFLVSAGVEYGIAFGTLGAGAAGPAEAAETIVDAFFLADSIKEVVGTLKDAATGAGDFSDLFNGAMESVKSAAGNLEGLYEKIKEIVKSSLSVLGKGAKDVIDEFAEKLKKTVADMIKKISGGINSAIKFFIPDATIGTLVGEGIEKLLNTAAANCYTVLSSVLGKAGEFGKFFTDPNVAPRFFGDAIDSLINGAKELAKKIDDQSIFKKIIAGPSGMIGRKLGKTGLESLAKFLSEKKKTIVDLASTVSNLLVPALFSMLAIAQIILKNEYKSEEENSQDDKSKDKTEKSKEESKSNKITRGRKLERRPR